MPPAPPVDPNVWPCPTCGYNVHGLRSNQCPECGNTFDPEIFSPSSVRPISLADLLKGEPGHAICCVCAVVLFILSRCWFRHPVDVPIVVIMVLWAICAAAWRGWLQGAPSDNDLLDNQSMRDTVWALFDWALGGIPLADRWAPPACWGLLILFAIVMLLR